jgi:hypothetical protein
MGSRVHQIARQISPQIAWKMAHSDVNFPLFGDFLSTLFGATALTRIESAGLRRTEPMTRSIGRRFLFWRVGDLIVTLYRMNNYLDRPDGPKLGSFITKIDGLFHFENILKGEYMLRVQGVKSWGPELGPELDRRISILREDEAVEPETIVIDYKDSPPG